MGGGTAATAPAVTKQLQPPAEAQTRAAGWTSTACGASSSAREGWPDRSLAGAASCRPVAWRTCSSLPRCMLCLQERLQRSTFHQPPHWAAAAQGPYTQLAGSGQLAYVQATASWGPACQRVGGQRAAVQGGGGGAAAEIRRRGAEGVCVQVSQCSKGGGGRECWQGVEGGNKGMDAKGGVTINAYRATQCSGASAAMKIARRGGGGGAAWRAGSAPRKQQHRCGRW